MDQAKLWLFLAEDYSITISFSDATGASDLFSASGFSHASPITFTFTLDSASSGNELTINVTPQPPSGLQADAMTSGGLKTHLSWNAVSGASIYRVYGRNTDEPYFSQIGQTSGLYFDTNDPWAQNSSITTRVYAVSAVKSDGTESFFSNVAENNDRDHDGLTDGNEAALGTDPNNPDTDGDGLKDGEEYILGTNPLLADTDGDGYSDYTEVQAGSDPLDANSIPCKLPSTPGLISPSDGAPNVSITTTLDWSDVSGTTSYDVQVCSDNSCSSIVNSGNITGSQWTVSPALSLHTTYYWRVRAINSCGDSSWSDIWSFTTAACIRGDVNRDGSINASDLQLTVNVILGIPECTLLKYPCADVNQDGESDVLDLQSLINIILFGT
jgi:Dockerin type I domain/Bacterial TSP3 repeat